MTGRPPLDPPALGGGTIATEMNAFTMAPTIRVAEGPVSPTVMMNGDGVDTLVMTTVMHAHPLGGLGSVGPPNGAVMIALGTITKGGTGATAPRRVEDGLRNGGDSVLIGTCESLSARDHESGHPWLRDCKWRSNPERLSNAESRWLW